MHRTIGWGEIIPCCKTKIPKISIGEHGTITDVWVVDVYDFVLKHGSANWSIHFLGLILFKQSVDTGHWVHDAVCS